MTSKDIEKIFIDSGALLHGHFLLTSGNHGDAYLEKFRIYEQPAIHSNLITEMLGKFAGKNIDVVLGPALGGVIMASEAGRQLGVRAVYAEKENGRLTLRRGFKLNKSEKVLIVDDILTTGGSVKETIAIAQEAGTEIVGIGILADRSGGKADLGVPYTALMTLDLPIYDPQNCPLCVKGMPLVKPGSRQIV